MMKKKIIFTLLVTVLMLAVAGCGKTKAADTDDSEIEELSQEDETEKEDNLDDENGNQISEVADESADEAGEQKNSNEEPVEAVLDDGLTKKDANSMFEEWIAGERNAYAEDGWTVVYAEITDPDLDWEMYNMVGKEDVDNDSEPELLLTGPYGLLVVDAVDDELMILACGNGTAQVCAAAKYNEVWWILYMDVSHMGRQTYEMVCYQGYGNIVDSTCLSAEYWESENDRYDENSDFHLGDNVITMSEFESIRDELNRTMIR